MMSDVLQQSSAVVGGEVVNASPNVNQPPGPAVGVGRGLPTPSHDRLQRRVSGYRERAKDHLHHYDTTNNAFTTQHKDDTKKLMKKFVDNAKPKKSNKKNNNLSESKMKPQLQPQAANGLKRPHPGANNQTSTSDVLASSEAKRMNLDQNTANLKLEVKQETEPPVHVKSEAVHQDTSEPNVKVETKQEPQAPDQTNNSNDVSLNDFELDLENTDFQDLIQDISDLNPDMLDFEFNDKSDFDDLAGQLNVNNTQPMSNSVNRDLSSQHQMPPVSVPSTNADNQAASEKLKFMAQQRQQHQMPQQSQHEQQQPIMSQQQSAAGAPGQQPGPHLQYQQQYPPHQIPHSSYNAMPTQQHQRMMYPQQQQQQQQQPPQIYHPHHQQQMMPNGPMPGMPYRHGIRPGIRPGNMGMMMGGPPPGQPMMGPGHMMSNGMGPGGPPGGGGGSGVSLPTTPLPKSSGGSPNNNNSNSISTSASSTPTSTSATPPLSRATPPITSAPSSTCSNSIVPISSSSPNTNGPPPRMPNAPNNMRMSMNGPPPGPPMGGQMYGNNMMSDVRMRAQSRYRLGTPSASSMRQSMPGGPVTGAPPGPQGMTVPPGQQSPMGNNMGPMGNPSGNMPMMPNQNMRPQMPPSSVMSQQQHHQQQMMMQQQRMQMANNMGMMRPDQMNMGPNNGMMGHHMRPQMNPQMMMQMQQQQQHPMHMQQNRPPPPDYNKMMPHQNQNMNYMMNQMGHNNMGPGPPGGIRYGGPPGGPPMGNGPPMNGPRMGPRGQGFQSIPPSGPMMRQQVAPPNMMGNGPGDMQRMRLPPNHMMPMSNGPQKVPVSHPSPLHPNDGSPGMWNNMGSGSPNPNGMPMQQQQSIGSPRTPGDQNHGSPMMQQNMRSQTPVMNPVPNSQQGMGQPRMVGPQGNMGPMNSRMSMMPQHGNVMHQMHPGQQPGQPPPPQSQQSQQNQGQSSPARASPMSHASPMGVNHSSPHPQQMMNQMNPATKSQDDYNLDFLDNIPNDESGGAGGGPGSGPVPSSAANENNGPNRNSVPSGANSGANDDDLMTLLDS